MRLFLNCFCAAAVMALCVTTAVSQKPDLPTPEELRLVPNIVPVRTPCSGTTGFYTGIELKDGKFEVVTSHHLFRPTTRPDGTPCVFDPATMKVVVDTFPAQVVGRDEEKDWVILAAPRRHELVLEKLTSRAAVPGEEVFSFSYPNTLPTLFTLGKVTETSPLCMPGITAPFPHGSSGSPVFARKDRAWVGIVRSQRYNVYREGSNMIALWRETGTVSSHCIADAIQAVREKSGLATPVAHVPATKQQ